MFDLKDVRPKGFKRTRRVNGEKVIEFTAISFEENKSTFDLIVEESSVNALNDKYIIKKLSEQSRGKTYIKNVTAIHEFFVNLINKQQPTIHNGSITFNNYMNLVFEDTPYTFVAIDHFPAREFENLGNDNRLALLQKGLDRFQAEFELVGNQVRFKQQIGNDTDFQFRYGHNIKALKVDIDTTNLATHIQGTGDPELGIEAEYTSPNSAIYGIIDAPPVNDERFKSEPALLEEMKRRLIDEPEISITVDFVDLRQAGYPYTVPNEGDRVWLIYEPMNDLLIETRIMEIVEYFKYDEENDEFVVIKTEVTLSNDKKTFAGTMFDNVRKQLRQIVNDDGIIKYSALDDAVKIATEALHSAQTELEFNNGIIAREKTDPNRLVVLNSAGLGISKDGGNTFQEAITADGFVLSVGAIGRLSANHIQIGPETIYNESDFDPDHEYVIDGNISKNADDFLFGGVLYQTDLRLKDVEIGDKFEFSFEFFDFKGGLGVAISLDALDIMNNLFHKRNIDWGSHTHTFTVSSKPAGNPDSYFHIAISGWNTVSGNDFNMGNVTLKKIESGSEKQFEVWIDDKIEVTDSLLRNDLRLTSPLPTTITMNQDGITAHSIFAQDSYARLDYRGLYIRNGAIQIDGDFGAPVMQGFNDIGNQVKISSAGLSTYSGGLRTSLLRGSGHTFYRDGYTVGEIGTAAWIDDPNYHGLLFRLEHDADYMTWAFRQTIGENPITMLAWHKTSEKEEKGFTFSDNVRITEDLKVSYLRTDTSSSRIISLINSTWEGIEGVAIRRDPNRDRGEGGIFIASSRVALTVPQTQGSSTHTALEVTRNYIRSVAIYNQTTSSASNVYISSNANLLRSTSASKYKLLIENEEEKGYDFNRILNLNVKSWYDKLAVETYAEVLNGNLTESEIDSLPITRHFGLIAEDVYNVGLTEFVTFGKDGEVEGIEYDRLWVLLIPVAREHEVRLDEFDRRFNTVESRIDVLEQEITLLKGAS